MNVKIYPDPILRSKTVEITKFDDDLKKTIDEMLLIMNKKEGIGLASTQVGILKRFFIIQIKNKMIFFANPKIISKSRKEVVMEEGCLSIPNFYITILRPEELIVEAYDIEGKKFTYKASKLTARAILHETDHLNGKLIVDYLLPEDRLEFEKNWQKEF